MLALNISNPIVEEFYIQECKNNKNTFVEKISEYIQISVGKYKDDSHVEDYESSILLSNMDEVKKKAQEAEKRIQGGNFLTEEEYREKMDQFLVTL